MSNFIISSGKMSQTCSNRGVWDVSSLLEHHNGAGTDGPPVPQWLSVNSIEWLSSKCEPWYWNFQQHLCQTIEARTSNIYFENEIIIAVNAQGAFLKSTFLPRP